MRTEFFKLSPDEINDLDKQKFNDDQEAEFMMQKARVFNEKSRLVMDMFWASIKEIYRL